ncbi:MAG: AMP-binding protein, partial [Syntrophales bacterium]
MFGEYPFIIFEDVTFTNRQMIHHAKGLAGGLKKLGVNKGDNVVVMLPNCPEVLISYQGILRCGAVIVPLIPLLNETELAHILSNCEATAMITTHDIFWKNAPMLRTINPLKNIILVDNNTPEGTFLFWSLIRDHSETPALPAIAEEDLAVILYTAGTTSTPKGVMLT